MDFTITEELSMQVLGNDMLRESIFKYAISSCCNTSHQLVGTLRLVQKSWLRTVSEIFRKAHRPLFKVISNKTTPEGDNYSSSLEELLSSLKSLSGETTYSISLLPHFFTPQNYTNFSECLTNYGHLLVCINVTFPYSSAMSLIFPPIYLPHLQKITVQFSDLTANKFNPGTGGNTPALHFLQTVFHGTEELKQVHFKDNQPSMQVPLGFEFLIIPETVTSLYLDCPLQNFHFNIVHQSYIQKLSSLSLFATNVPFSDGLINDILERFKGQLVSLSLRGNRYQGRVRTTTLFRFPHMSQLESLTVTSQCWELEENITNLQENLPKLKEFRMLNTTNTMFQKYCQDSIYPTVDTLFVSLINADIVEMVNPHYVEVPCTLTLQRTQALHLAFPNVVSLEIHLAGPINEGLSYIFMEMQLLKKLVIRLKGHGAAIWPEFFWDSVLIGAPQDLVATLSQWSDFQRVFNLQGDGVWPSIRKLTSLQTLALVEEFNPSVPGPPLITKMAFNYAFLRMPNLKHLVLHGRFSTPELHQLWKMEKNEDIRSLVSSE